MVRWLSIGVIGYMILGIVWWGVLLYRKNGEIYDLKMLEVKETSQLHALEKERSKQTIMIIGEGAVLGISLLLGIYIINRSARKEINNAQQQSDFLLSVSHELKSPIAAIKLALQTIKRPNIPKDKETKFLKSAEGDTNRLEKLVQNILLSANIDNHTLELYKTETDIMSLLKKVIANYEREHFDQSFQLIADTEEIIISVDEQNVQQAISNILDNAIKYSEDDQPVSIKVTDLKKIINIDIQNTGVPIKKEDYKKIFQKFYRVKQQEIREKEGTGIGLYISKEIIEAHTGDIEVKSEKGINHFIITLPKVA